MSEASAPLVELPDTLRQRLERVAAVRGETLTAMVETVLSRFLDDAERRAPKLDEVVAKLRTLEPALRERAVSAVWVFGSVARGDATRDSDIDVAIDYDEGSRFSLLDLVHLKDVLGQELGYRVDVLTRNALKPLIARSAAEDMVRVY